MNCHFLVIGKRLLILGLDIKEEGTNLPSIPSFIKEGKNCKAIWGGVKKTSHKRGFR
jgi:hypothetical protein